MVIISDRTDAWQIAIFGPIRYSNPPGSSAKGVLGVVSCVWPAHLGVTKLIFDWRSNKPDSDPDMLPEASIYLLMLRNAISSTFVRTSKTV